MNERLGIFLDKSDILTAMPFRSTPLKDFDFRSSSEERCGRASSTLNVSFLCSPLSILPCHCGQSTRSPNNKNYATEM